MSSLVSNSQQQAKADLLREAQLSLDVIVKDIRLSGGADPVNSVADTNSPGASENFGIGWESNDNTLVLSRSAEDNNRNILFQDANRYVTEKDNVVYFVNEGSLYKRTLAADVESNRRRTSCPKDSSSESCPADLQLVKNVSNFTLKYFDGMNNEVEPEQAQSVEASLDLSVNKFGKNIEANYKTRTVFRNE